MGVGYKRGDVVISNFPLADKAAYKPRPALIVSESKLPSKDYILCQFTTKYKDDDFTFLLYKENDFINVQKQDSYVRIHKLFTVNEKLIPTCLASITTSAQLKVRKVIQKLF